jgi:hypothetical protein
VKIALLPGGEIGQKAAARALKVPRIPDEPLDFEEALHLFGDAVPTARQRTI